MRIAKYSFISIVLGYLCLMTFSHLKAETVYNDKEHIGGAHVNIFNHPANHYNFVKQSSAAQTVPSSEHQKLLVTNAKELYEAIDLANNTRAKNAIFLKNGLYKLHKTLVLKSDSMMILSLSEDPNKVVLSGLGSYQTKQVNNLILVMGSNIVIDGITLISSPNHLIQVAGEHGANNFKLRNSILKDSYEQLLKVTSSDSSFSSNGLIEHCLFKFTQGTAFNFYTGGIDAHGAKNWLVSDSLFYGIASPAQKIAQYAVHFWNRSENNIVRDNLFINNDRSIGFGMRLHGNSEKVSNKGGRILRNIIIHSNAFHQFSDTGIMVESSPDTIVSDNFVYHSHSYDNAIEVRFRESERVKLHRNMVNKRIVWRDDSAGIVLDTRKFDESIFSSLFSSILAKQAVQMVPDIN